MVAYRQPVTRADVEGFVGCRVGRRCGSCWSGD